jgi:hypothetical protein
MKLSPIAGIHSFIHEIITRGRFAVSGRDQGDTVSTREGIEFKIDFDF